MNTKKRKIKILYKDLSYKIVRIVMEVCIKLGYGFLEKVYENEVMILLCQQAIRVKQQVP